MEVSTTMMIIVTIVITLCIIFYRLIIVTPLNRIRRLGDVGYGSDASRLQIGKMQRSRCVGDIPPVYPNGWYSIAESRQLAVGKVRSVIIFGQQFALMRASDGTAHLLDAYCPHLGANLTVGGRVVDGNCLQCPFHGWTFSGATGKCVRIPYSIGRAPETAKAKLDVYPIVEINANIYLWFHSDGIAPQWHIPVIDEIATGEWSYMGRSEHEVNAHIQDLPENAGDVAHLSVLHLAGINQGGDITTIDAANGWTRHEWQAEWCPEPAPCEHIGQLRLDHCMRLFGWRVPFASNRLIARQIGPGIVYMMFDFGWLLGGRGATLFHNTPEQPLLQRTSFVLFASRRMPALFAKLFLHSEAMHYERDIAIWNNKRYVKSPILCREDATLLKHRRWFAQFYCESSPRLLDDGSITGGDGNLIKQRQPMIALDDW